MDDQTKADELHKESRENDRSTHQERLNLFVDHTVDGRNPANDLGS